MYFCKQNEYEDYKTRKHVLCFIFNIIFFRFVEIENPGRPRKARSFDKIVLRNCYYAYHAWRLCAFCYRLFWVPVSSTFPASIFFVFFLESVWYFLYLFGPKMKSIIKLKHKNRLDAEEKLYDGKKTPRHILTPVYPTYFNNYSFKILL